MFVDYWHVLLDMNIVCLQHVLLESSPVSVMVGVCHLVTGVMAILTVGMAVMRRAVVGVCEHVYKCM